MRHASKLKFIAKGKVEVSIGFVLRVKLRIIIERVMKRFISICMLLGSCLTMLAQATSLVVDNQTPGWLSSKINYGDQATVRNLKVTGYINATDLKFIGSLMKSRNLTGRLDISEVRFVGGDVSGDRDDVIREEYWGISEYINLECLLLPIQYIPSRVSSPYILNKYFYIDSLYLNKVIEESDARVSKIMPNLYECRVRNLFYHESTDSINGNALTPNSHYYSDSKINLYFSKRTKYIDDNAFTRHIITIGETNLKDLDSLSYLGIYSLRWKPDSLYIPKGLKSFNMQSFTNSPNYDPFKDGQHIFIGKNITSIEGNTSRSVILHMENETPPKLATALRDKVTVYVPAGTGDSYRNDEKWKNATIIEKIAVTKITLNSHVMSLENGGQQSLSAMITPSNAEDATLSWYSENDDIVTVSQDGEVTAKSPGTTWVYAINTPTGVKDSCKVTVIQHVSGIKIDPSEITFSKIGETKQLSVEVLPANATDKSVKWTSSNESVCTVTESGHIVALNNGSAIIIATTTDGNYPATCVVTIDTSTGIAGVMADGGVVRDANGVVLHGMKGESVSVVNSQGVVVYRGMSTGNRERVTLPKGLYMITIGAKTMKIVL